MPSHKLGRTTEDIRREISAILRELKDPRVSGVMLSVVRVEVTNDLSYCTVYVSAMEGMDAAKNAVKGLKSAAGFVRRERAALPESMQAQASPQPRDFGRNRPFFKRTGRILWCKTPVLYSRRNESCSQQYTNTAGKSRKKGPKTKQSKE